MRGIFRLILLSCILLSFYCGCAKYKKQSLVTQDYEERSCSLSKNNIDLSVALFTPKESRDYLPHYHLLHLKIKNKTNSAVTLATHNISLPLARLSDIKKQQPSIFIKNLIPSFIFCLAGIFFWWNICLPLAVVFGISGVEYSAHQNGKNINTLKTIALFKDDSTTLTAHSTQNVICFIKKEAYAPRFTITLETTEKEMLTFDVTIIARVKHAYKVI